MGSIMDSRYWVCPECFTQFDWDSQAEEIQNHNCLPETNEDVVKEEE